MTLQEAIEHCHEKAEQLECENGACSANHKQLEGWLTELQERQMGVWKDHGQAETRIMRIRLKDYSCTPGGRTDARRWRKTRLLPAFRNAKESGELLVVNLDGTAGLAASFLEEAFGGLVRSGVRYGDILAMMLIESKEDKGEMAIEAERYMLEAEDAQA